MTYAFFFLYIGHQTNKKGALLFIAYCHDGIGVIVIFIYADLF